MILDDIRRNIEELDKLVGSTDIDGKTELAEHLANRLCTLAEMAGTAYKASCTAGYLYNSAVLREKAYGQGPVAQREAKAKTDNTKLHQEEVEQDCVYRACVLLLNQGNALLEQTRQSIANLKREFR